MQQANQVFITTLLIILAGYLLKRYRIITEADAKVVSKLLMHTTFPALMFVSTVDTQLDASLLFIPFSYVLYSCLGLSVAWLVFAKYPNHLRGLFLMAFGATNVGMFGFPIVEGLFGKDALRYAIMYDIGNTIFGFGVIYPIAKHFSMRDSIPVTAPMIIKRVLSLPPFIGLLLGLTLNFINVEPPQFLMHFAHVVAQGNKPIGLLLLGFFLSFDLEKAQFRNIAKALSIKYLFCFLLIIGLYVFIPPSTYRNMLMLCAIFPLGITILPFSVEMNYDSKIAGTMVNMSLLISFIVLWALVLGFQMV